MRNRGDADNLMDHEPISSGTTTDSRRPEGHEEAEERRSPGGHIVYQAIQREGEDGRGGIQSYYCRFCGDVIFGRYGRANLPPVLSPLHVADACRQYNRRNLAGGGAGARTVRCQRAARTGLATRVPRPGKSDLALFTICT